jgi:hypothetical protein
MGSKPLPNFPAKRLIRNAERKVHRALLSTPFAVNHLGARGCIDVRLRRVGAISHNKPAAAERQEPPTH